MEDEQKSEALLLVRDGSVNDKEIVYARVRRNHNIDRLEVIAASLSRMA